MASPWLCPELPAVLRELVSGFVEQRLVLGVAASELAGPFLVMAPSRDYEFPASIHWISGCGTQVDPRLWHLAV